MTTTCESHRLEDCHALHLRYAESRDPEVRAELVEAYHGLVQSMARRFAGRGESFDDLVQVAYVGLLQALDRFDPRHGRPFAVFAVPTIVGELKKHFRDHRWRVRVSRQLQERYLEVREARNRLIHELARVPTLADIAADLGMTVDDVAEALEAGSTFTMASLDRPRALGSPPDHLWRTRNSGFDAVENRLHLQSLLDRLSPAQREVLRLRFHGELTQSEIAHRLGVSQMQVSRVLSRTLSSLRATTTDRDL